MPCARIGITGNPYFPFFHLQGPLRDGSASFWHLHARPGHGEVLAALSSARSSASITDNIEFASLDLELFTHLQLPAHVDRLSAALSEVWSDRGLEEPRAVVVGANEVSRYERWIRTGVPVALASEASPPAYVRGPAFRRVVHEMYDYRCAATGLRVVLPDGTAMVEAAHVHTFSAPQDDDPRNGLALTPDMHWAMDQHLIVPRPDFK